MRGMAALYVVWLVCLAGMWLLGYWMGGDAEKVAQARREYNAKVSSLFKVDDYSGTLGRVKVFPSADPNVSRKLKRRVRK